MDSVSQQPPLTVPDAPHPVSSPAIEESRWQRLAFYPVAVGGAVFCITVLASIAALMGDPNAPVNQWINRNANRILIAEVVVVVVLSVAAMAIDQFSTSRRLRKQNAVASSIRQERQTVQGAEHVD